MAIGPDRRRALEARGDLIRRVREVEELSQAELASRVGGRQQAIDKIEKGLVEKSALLPEVAKVLNLELDPSTQTLSPTPTTEAKLQIAASFNKIRNVFDGKPDAPTDGAAAKGFGPVPVYNVGFRIVEGTVGQVASDTPAVTTLRPTPLFNVVGAYALFISSDEMAPVCRTGDVLLVNPEKPASPQCEVVLSRPIPGGRELLIRTLMAVDGRSYRLRTWEPRWDTEEDRSAWEACHVVVGKFARP